MRIFLAILCCGAALSAAAQPKTVTQATITTKTTIVALDGEQAPEPVPQPSGDGGPVVIRRRMDDAGETVSKTFLKGHLLKTVVDNSMGRTTTIRDNQAKLTTTLMEIMGTKRGFYASDNDQAEMNRRMDSLTKAGGTGQAAATPPVVQVVYRPDTKTIAGYNCQKAVVYITQADGTEDSSVVWYNTDLRLEGLTMTGGAGGGFMSFRRSNNADILGRIKGFPMQYEMKMGHNRNMLVEVTKLDIEKEIKASEFEVSKDFELKPAKEMMGPGGNMQIRIGGPGPGGH
jgi:hypothetical protein